MLRLTRRQLTLTAATAVPTAVIGGIVPGVRRALANQSEAIGAGGADPVVAVSPDGGTAYLVWFQPAEAALSTIQFARSTDGDAVRTLSIATTVGGS